MAFDPSLWVHLHPIRWANGHLNFFTPTNFSLLSSERYDRESSDDSKEEGIMMIHDAVIENDIVKELMSVEGKVNANLRGKR